MLLPLIVPGFEPSRNICIALPYALHCSLSGYCFQVVNRLAFGSRRVVLIKNLKLGMTISF